VLIASTLAVDGVRGREQEPAPEQAQVLVLYASRRDAQIAVLGDARLPRLIEAGLSTRVDYYSEYLEVARFRDMSYHDALDEFLVSKYRDKRFDLVIAMHDLALEFAVGHRDRLFRDIPIVFYSSTGDIERPRNSAGAVTGTAFAPTVSLAMALQPDLQRLVVITGSDPRDQAYERDVRAELQPFASRLDIRYWSGLGTPDLKGRLRTLPKRSAVYYVLVNRDGDGRYFHPLEYFEDIAPEAAVPIYSWVDSTMGRGILGGSLKSQERQIEAVAGMAVRVLSGEAADSIPLAAPDVNVPQVDWREVRRWGIDPARVPSGTVRRFEEPTLWERYWYYAVGTAALVLAQTALISGLLLSRRRRRRAEEQTRRTETELRSSYERIRSLGSRLLHAQETERAHIARELHDDISQQLALLSIDLQMWWKTRAAGGAGLDGQPFERLDAVARSVHDLSHRLYPAKLRLIGLTAALNGLQRELSRSEVEADIRCENLPASLPPDVTLCLYRVVQEALQNVLKHARARHVLVRVTGGDERVTLTVVDDGTGFDVTRTAERGLGLISMRERLEALGGRLQVRSTPGSGTRIEVEVPVRTRTDHAEAV
jgi:signal transduction histidine kinase